MRDLSQVTFPSCLSSSLKSPCCHPSIPAVLCPYTTQLVASPYTHCVLPEYMDSSTLLDQNPRVIQEAFLPIPVHKPVLVALFLPLSDDFYPSYRRYSSGLPLRCGLMTSPPTAYSAAAICFEYSSQCDPLSCTSGDCTLC